MPPTFPDPWGANVFGDNVNYTTFIFGFRDLSDRVLQAIPQSFLNQHHLNANDPESVYNFLGRGKAQLSAPIIRSLPI